MAVQEELKTIELSQKCQTVSYSAKRTHTTSKNPETTWAVYGVSKKSRTKSLPSHCRTPVLQMSCPERLLIKGQTSFEFMGQRDGLVCKRSNDQALIESISYCMQSRFALLRPRYTRTGCPPRISIFPCQLSFQLTSVFVKFQLP